MDFLPQNDLEKALLLAVSEPASRPQFYRLLLQSELFVLGKIENQRLQIASVKGNAPPTHPVFTALLRLKAYIREKQDYLELNGRALFTATRGANFVLNPGSAVGKEFLAGEIEALLDPRAHVAKPITLEKATEVLIGQPLDYPHALIDALKVEFSLRSDVRAAYLAQIAFEGQSEAPHPLIGVESSGDWDEISATIGRTAAMVSPGILLDAVPVDRTKPASAFTANLLQTTPFFQSADVSATS